MFYKHITFHLAMAQGLLSRMISNIGILISLALLHSQSMLVLVSALYSVQLLSVLRKQLVISQYNFSLLFIGHYRLANLV